MKIIWKIILLFIIFIGIIGVFGYPHAFNYLGFTWIFPEPTNHTVTKTISHEGGILKLESLSMKQDVYRKGDKAEVDFTIKDTAGIPYNITLNWYNQTNYKGNWITNSSEIYNNSRGIHKYTGYYYVEEDSGEWDVQLIMSAVDGETIVRAVEKVEFEVK